MSKEIKCSYSQLVKIEELQENPKNATLHPYNDNLINRLAEVIDYQGLRKPIIVSNLSGFIVTGHATYKALQKLEWKEVPIDLQDFDSQDQEMAHLIADNSLTYWREINKSAVNIELQNFDGHDFDVNMLGMNDFRVEPMEVYTDDLDSLADKFIDENGKPLKKEKMWLYVEFESQEEFEFCKKLIGHENNRLINTEKLLEEINYGA